MNENHTCLWKTLKILDAVKAQLNYRIERAITGFAGGFQVPGPKEGRKGSSLSLSIISHPSSAVAGRGSADGEPSYGSEGGGCWILSSASGAEGTEPAVVGGIGDAETAALSQRGVPFVPPATRTHSRSGSADLQQEGPLVRRSHSSPPSAVE